MLAELIAILVVAIPVLGPGSYLLHVAWKRGGGARKLAKVVLFVVCVLIVLLLSPLGPSIPQQDRIEFFVGAWGILFMVVGALAVGAVIVSKLRTRSRPRTDE